MDSSARLRVILGEIWSFELELTIIYERKSGLLNANLNVKQYNANEIHDSMFTVCAIDQEMNLHKVIIDGGNGKTLLTTVLPMQKFMLNHMMGPMMGSNMMESIMNPGCMGHMMR